MTMTEERKVPAELLEEYAPEDVQGNWSSLADMVERRKVELAFFISRLQEAYAAQAVASGRLCLRLGDEWTDQLENGLREASGFARLVDAVGEAGLWPSVEARDETAEESALAEQYLARVGREEATR